MSSRKIQFSGKVKIKVSNLIFKYKRYRLNKSFYVIFVYFYLYIFTNFINIFLIIGE